MKDAYDRFDDDLKALAYGDPQTCGASACAHFPFLRSLSVLESFKAIRVVRAVPAIVSRKFCICGVNFRRSGSFMAKDTIQ
jgi:hypothetical protein